MFRHDPREYDFEYWCAVALFANMLIWTAPSRLSKESQSGIAENDRTSENDPPELFSRYGPSCSELPGRQESDRVCIGCRIPADFPGGRLCGRFDGDAVCRRAHPCRAGSVAGQEPDSACRRLLSLESVKHHGKEIGRCRKSNLQGLCLHSSLRWRKTEKSELPLSTGWLTISSKRESMASMFWAEPGKGCF